jgi:predicted nucleotidyltransferase component of viral defense system
MSNLTPTNFSASAYAKLKNIADTNGWNFMHLLIRYATERFLYRLSVSPYAEQFVLKGGNLFVIWQNGQNYRPTIDSDLLCFGNTGEQHLQTIFVEMCRSTACGNDGMIFDADSIEISPIREDTEYGGTRFVLNAYLGQARIRLQFDIGIGDAITPSPELAEYPALLGHPAPRLKIYPMATAIAEKTEAMVSRGLLNSRMKDFYDIWLLSELFDHDYTTLCNALRNTFERRNVPLPTATPDAWTEEFSSNPAKVVQWRAFLRKNKLDAASADFAVTVARIATFLRPVCFPPNTPPTTWTAALGWQ